MLLQMVHSDLNLDMICGQGDLQRTGHPYIIQLGVESRTPRACEGAQVITSCQSCAEQ